MIITISVLAVLVFILSTLFAGVTWHFMRRARRNAQVVKSNHESSVEDEVQKPIESKIDKVIIESKIEEKIEPVKEEKITQEDVKETAEESASNFKVEQVKTEEKSSKPSGLRASNISPMAGSDLASTELDLARVYLDIGSEREAKKLLRHVLDKGSEKQQLSAKKLLEKFNILV